MFIEAEEMTKEKPNNSHHKTKPYNIKLDLTGIEESRIVESKERPSHKNSKRKDKEERARENLDKRGSCKNSRNE